MAPVKSTQPIGLTQICHFVHLLLNVKRTQVESASFTKALKMSQDTISSRLQAKGEISI